MILLHKHSRKRLITITINLFIGTFYTWIGMHFRLQQVYDRLLVFILLGLAICAWLSIVLWMLLKEKKQSVESYVLLAGLLAGNYGMLIGCTMFLILSA